jgi:carboxypeptidase family protein
MNRFACSLRRSRIAVKKAAGVLTVIAALLAFSVPLFSQGAQGTIQGGVFDQTGGAIVGAKVTIIDVARGTTRELTTDASGQYIAPGLLPGTYTVRAGATGFETLDRTNVLLEVAEEVRVDLRLSPGAQTQTITVTDVAPAIDTVSSTLGGTVSNQEVASLPLVTRNFLDLLQLRPGVVYVPGTPTASASNGRREGSDVILVEGVTQFDLGTSNVLINGSQKGNAVNELPLDSIQEFNAEQNPPAEYGWRDGSGINLAVKSGTNAIHGSAYAFGRDAAATDSSLISALPPRQKNNLTVEQPGFTLGGPILKNKLFWFVSAEFIRFGSISTASVPSFADATLPTDGKCKLAAGATGSCDLSMFDACEDILKSGKPFNLLSAQIAGLVPVGAATQPTSCIPSASSSTVENLFPFTTTGTTFPNPPTDSPSNNGLAKVDYSPNDKQHFDGFFYISREATTTAGNYQPYWGSFGPGRTEEFAGAWTWTPNSNWVNELRGGAAPNTGIAEAQDFNAIPSQPYALGAGGVPTGYSINTGITTPGLGLVCLQISGLPTGSTGLGDCAKYGSRGPQYQLDFTDKVSWLHGNHALKFGYEEVYVRFDDASTANENGTVTFNGTSTGGVNVPGLEAFLLGLNPATASVIVGNNTDQWREHWHAAFVQDTWRVSQRVTLTPGVRWEYIGSVDSAVNHMGIFNPSVAGGVEQVGPGLPDSTLIHPQKFNFFPRGGVAWDVFGNGKTVLRGGIGLLGSFPSINTVAGQSVPYGATMCTATPCDGNHTANIVPGTNRFGEAVQTFFPITESFRGNLAWPSNNTTPIFNTGSAITSTSGPTCTPGKGACSMLTVDPNFKYPKSVQWNVDVQRAITNSLTLDVAYVGVHGYDETHTVDLNEPALGSGWNPSSPTSTIASCLGSLNLATYSSNCSPDTTAEGLARPYNVAFPYFGTIGQTQSGFVSNYNALQVTLTSRGYHGLSFIASYTFAHALDDWTKNSQATTALANPANPQYQYGNSDFDVRNRFRFSPVYAIPGTKKVPLQMAQGWQVSAIWALQSGFAWSPDDNQSDDWGGTGENGNAIPRPNNGVWQSWNYTGPHSAFNGNGDVPIPCWGNASGCTAFSAVGVPTSVIQACETAAQAPYGNAQQQQLALASLFSANGACYMQKGGILTPPAYGTLGDASRGLFVGPSFRNLDITLSKMWKVKENYSVTFRAECFNCLNETNWLPFSDGASDPSGGGGVVQGGGTFGFATSGVIQEGGSSNRQFQFGLKVLF